MRGQARRTVLAALLAAVACGRDASSGHDTAVTVVHTVTTAASTAVGGKAACPKTGHWTACQVRTRLEQAGVAPRDTSARALGDLPQLGSIPLTYEVGNTGLVVYLFPDTLSRHNAARSLDTLMFVPPNHELSMRGEGTVIQNDNLLALLFSRREQQRERVSDALMAGPPQP